jgi:hypothetical protein
MREINAEQGTAIGLRMISFGVIVFWYLIMTGDFTTEIIALLLFIFDVYIRRSE